MSADPDRWGPIGSAVAPWLTDDHHAVYQGLQHATTVPQQPPDASTPVTAALLIALGALVPCMGIALARRGRVRKHTSGTT